MNRNLQPDKRDGIQPWLFIVLFIFSASGLYFFLQNNYQVAFTKVKAVKFNASFEPYNLVLYTKGTGAAAIDFNRVYTPLPNKKPEFIYVLPEQSLRSFRIYLSQAREAQTISKLCVCGEDDTLQLSGKDFICRNMEVGFNADTIAIRKGPANSYLELKRDLITRHEWYLALVLLFVLALGLAAAGRYFLMWYLVTVFRQLNVFTASVALFVLCLFMPQALFNGTFILALLLNLKNFNARQLIKSPVSLLFILYFVYYTGTYYLRNASTPFASIETQLPVLFLPLLFASAQRYNYLGLLPTGVLIVGIVCFALACLNFAVYRNPDYFSFQLFTGYNHAVYYSYALAFSLMCVELMADIGINKTVYRLGLGLLLLLSGSKLILSFIVLFYVLVVFKNQRKLLLPVFGIVALLLLMFTPTRQRFKTVLDAEALGILKEKPLMVANDPRLNGLTLRLILWQEALSVIKEEKAWLLGIGNGAVANQRLQRQLQQRNLEQNLTVYDPHNQFISTVYKQGIFGLLILLSIIGTSVYVAKKKRKRLLFYTTLLFCTAMLAESVMQRVSGIYFFVTILILLSIYNTEQESGLPPEVEVTR